MKISWGRRRFIVAAANTSAVIAASGWASACSRDAVENTVISVFAVDNKRAALQQFSYLLFPFPDVGPTPYEQLSDSIITAMETTPDTAALIIDGLASLDASGEPPWLNADEQEQIDRLEAIEGEPFFAYMLNTTKTQLFNDRMIWAHVGFDANAPLNDIDWLGDE